MVYVIYMSSLRYYIGLFSTQIVPAIMYRYTHIRCRPDLLTSKGKPLITVIKARLEAVWKRLADRLSTVVADTSMISTVVANSEHVTPTTVVGDTSISSSKLYARSVSNTRPKT